MSSMTYVLLKGTSDLVAWRILCAEQDKAYEESLKANREKVSCRRTSLVPILKGGL